MVSLLLCPAMVLSLFVSIDQRQFETTGEAVISMLFILSFNDCWINDEYKELEFVKHKICKELLNVVFGVFVTKKFTHIIGCALQFYNRMYSIDVYDIMNTTSLILILISSGAESCALIVKSGSS